VPAKYIFGALIAYVLMAVVTAAMHPSGNDMEVLTDSLLWPIFAVDWLWNYMLSYYGRMFG